MNVGALVLAAGASRRMGAAKLALPMHGTAILAHTLAACSSAGLPRLVVTGAHAPALLPIIGDTPAVHAPAHTLGLAHSLHAGLAAAPADWDALLVVLADMPFVRPETLNALAQALAGGAQAVLPVLPDGQRGNPAGFARALWPRLMQLQGDQGARKLLDSLPVTPVPVNDPGIVRDIDLPQDMPAKDVPGQDAIPAPAPPAHQP